MYRKYSNCEKQLENKDEVSMKLYNQWNREKQKHKKQNECRRNRERERESLSVQCITIPQQLKPPPPHKLGRAVPYIAKLHTALITTVWNFW